MIFLSCNKSSTVNYCIIFNMFSPFQEKIRTGLQDIMTYKPKLLNSGKNTTLCPCITQGHTHLTSWALPSRKGSVLIMHTHTSFWFAYIWNVFASNLSLVTSSLSLTHREMQNKGQTGKEEITHGKGRRESDKSKIRRKKKQRDRIEGRKSETEMDKDCKILIVAEGI